MSDIARELDQAAREGEEKTELSDKGMPMTRDEVPHGARNDEHEGTAVVEPHHDKE